MYVVGNFVAGGAERHLLEMWRRIDRDRFDVEIVCMHARGLFLEEVLALGIPVRDLEIGRRIYGPAGVRGLWRLARHMHRFKPAVVHSYLFGPNLLAAVAGRLSRVPAVVIAKRNIDAFETPRQVAVQRFSARLATQVTAVSEAVADTVVALGVPRDRVTVIPNGVDADRFDATTYGIQNGVAVIGSVGCLAPRKDYVTLLDALVRLDQRGIAWRADLVGEGPERERLEQHALRLGLGERVRFLGERDDIEALLPTFDVFVLSSREEGIPNALLEAMAAGRPAVATAVGGTAEVMSDGETGWVVTAASPAALADALAQALTDRDEAERRGRAARRRVMDEMGIDAMVRRHEAFYRRVAGEDGS
jgi:glycosyltransferase involved in cell wall biosynthesis